MAYLGGLRRKSPQYVAPMQKAQRFCIGILHEVETAAVGAYPYAALSVGADGIDRVVAQAVCLFLVVAVMLYAVSLFALWRGYKQPALFTAYPDAVAGVFKQGVGIGSEASLPVVDDITLWGEIADISV